MQHLERVRSSLPIVTTTLGLGLLALAVIFLGAGGSLYDLQLVSLALIYGVVVLGLNITLGWTGLIDLSVAAFVGLGAYATAIATVKWDWPVSLAVAFALGVSAVVALVLGIPTLRLKTHYFALATLGISEIAQLVFQNERQLTGGAPGLEDIPRPSLGGEPLSFSGMTWFLFACLALVIVVLSVVGRTRFGKQLRALNEDELAAELNGIPVARVRLAAYVLATVVYAFGGALYAFQSQFISPDVFSLDLTVLIFAALVVGGSGSIAGAVFGAGLIIYLPELLRGLDEIYPSVYGALILVFLLVMPHGIVPTVADLARALLARTPARGLLFWPPPVPESVEAPLAAAAPRKALDGESRPVLSLEHVSIHFGGVRALDEVSMDLSEGEVHALIGPNGAGKSSLINGITGAYRLTRGDVKLDGHDLTELSSHTIANLGVARTFQNVRVFRELTVWENLTVSPPGDNSDDRTRAREAARWAQQLNLTPLLHRVASSLAFGELRRLELARALCRSPKVLLLDEPTSGLTGSEVDDVGQILHELRNEGRSLLLVEHNMNFVMGVADRITALEFGQVIAQGTPKAVREDPQVIEAYLGQQEEDQGHA